MTPLQLLVLTRQKLLYTNMTTDLGMKNRESQTSGFNCEFFAPDASVMVHGSSHHSNIDSP